MAFDSCRAGEYYDELRKCQLCSLIQNPYQEILCPCEPTRNAVIGCKSSRSESNLCRRRSDALEECARRGYTSSLAPSTTTSASSTASSSALSTGRSSEAAFIGELTQRHSSAVTSMYASGSPVSTKLGDDFALALGMGVGMVFMVFCIVIGVLLYIYIQNRRKDVRRQKVMYRDVDLEKPDMSRKLIDSPCESSVQCPKGIIVNGATSCDHPNSSTITNHYQVTINKSRFLQAGNRNVMVLGEQISEAVGSVIASNNEEQTQGFGSDDSDGSDVETTVVVHEKSRTRPPWNATRSGIAKEESQFLGYMPMPHSDIFDHRDEGYPYSGDSVINTTNQIRTENCTSHSPSADLPGEEQHASALARPLSGPTSPLVIGVAGFLEGGEGNGSHNSGDESSTNTRRDLPRQIADCSSKPIDAAVSESPISPPAKGSACFTGHVPMLSPLGINCDTADVSERNDGGTAQMLAQTWPSLSISGQVNADCSDEKESVVVNCPAEQFVDFDTSGVLTSPEPWLSFGIATPIQIKDKDPNLPEQSRCLYSLPLGGTVQPCQAAAV